MKYLVLFGRILFSLIFINTIFSHLSSPAVEYASAAGVPFASIVVPISGIIAFLGGLSIILGYKAKIGAWLIVIFLIPVTLFMHNFWAIQDSAEAQMQMTQFMKNISMLGGAFFITYFGSGPLSFDARLRVSQEIAKEPVSRIIPKLSRERDRKTERFELKRSKDKEKTDKQSE